MKTSHQLARELLAGPDLPCYHFDPSRAGMDPEMDTSVSDPIVEVVEPTKRDGVRRPFITLVGENDGAEPKNRAMQPQNPKFKRFVG
jgi:hypothetical protein